MPAAPQMRNSLSGSIPSCLSGLKALTLLDVSQNRLTSTLPPELALVGNKLGVSVFDNLVRAPATQLVRG
jgi:hypothetical protein